MSVSCPAFFVMVTRKTPLSSAIPDIAMESAGRIRIVLNNKEKRDEGKDEILIWDSFIFGTL